nr:E3 ubiquitin-protein ligase RNF139 isoform X2 [Equus asinus]
MAAVGPPQQQVRMAHQQVWAALEVALRVPCLYIIDAIFNSYYDSSQGRFCIGLQILLRLLACNTACQDDDSSSTQLQATGCRTSPRLVSFGISQKPSLSRGFP